MTGKDWINFCLILVGIIVLTCVFLSPVLASEWASNIVKNHETHYMDKLATGKIDRSIDCYGYSATKLSDLNMDKITGLFFNDAGQRIEIRYLRTDVIYTLYKIRLLGSFYYLECGVNNEIKVK